MKNEADFGVIGPNGKEDESGTDFPSGKCSGPSGTLDPLGKKVLICCISTNTQFFLVKVDQYHQIDIVTYQKQKRRLHMNDSMAYEMTTFLIHFRI